MMLDPTAAWIMTWNETRRPSALLHERRRGDLKNRKHFYLVLLSRNNIPQSLCPIPPFLLNLTPVNDRTKCIYFLSIDQNVHSTEIRRFVRCFFVIERSESRSDWFEGRMESSNDWRKGERIQESDSRFQSGWSFRRRSGGTWWKVSMWERNSAMRLNFQTKEKIQWIELDLSQQKSEKHWLYKGWW